MGLLKDTHLSTEEGVYGLILVAGLIAVAGASGLGPIKTLGFVVITVAVFWSAHVYAGAVAAHSGGETAGMSLRAAIRHAMRRSRGLLIAAIPPAIPFIMSGFGMFDALTAAWVALWIIVAVLGLLGYVAYARRGSPLYIRLLGAVSTAAFGIVIIIAKALIHH